MEKELEKDAPLPSSRINCRAFTHLNNSEEFKPNHNGIKYPSCSKRWIQPHVEERINREMMSTLITMEGVDSYDYVDKLIENHISYNDFASMSLEDLELLGFKNRKQCGELLASFRVLPNQDASYQSIIECAESKKYGIDMFNKATLHLEAMIVALSATNHKMQIKAPKDLLLGEKYYTSHFVLQTLNVLRDMTFKVENEVNNLKKVIKESEKKHSKSPSFKRYALIISSLFVGIVSAVMLSKSMKQ